MKNERNPFDTAVVIDLPTYRLETQKLDYCDSLITGRHKEVDSLRAQVKTDFAIVESQTEQLNLSSQSINVLVNQLSECEKRKKWFNNPFLWFGFGIIGGVIIAK